MNNVSYDVISTIVPVQELSVKELCYGLAGANLLIIVMVLIALNFLAFFFWKNLKRRAKLFGKEFDLLYFLPVINASVLSFVFVMIYNIF